MLMSFVYLFFRVSRYVIRSSSSRHCQLVVILPHFPNRHGLPNPASQFDSAVSRDMDTSSAGWLNDGLMSQHDPMQQTRDYALVVRHP